MDQMGDVLIATNETALAWMRVFGVRMPEGPHPVVASAAEAGDLVARAGCTAQLVDSVFDRSSSSQGGCIELLIGSESQRRVITGVRAHIAPTTLPAGCLWKSMTEGYYITSPELLFGMMSRTKDLIGAALLGYELCGSFCLDPHNPREVVSRNPLTTPERIEEVLTDCGLFGNRAMARRALGYVAAGSASPMESRAALVSVLPRSMGGFGMPAPVLNGKVQLTPEEQRRLGRSCLYCDLLWEDLGVAIEYDSSTFHGTGRELSQTLDRRSVLEEKGIHVLSLTHADMADARLLACKAEALAKVAGLRKRPFTEKALDKMAELLAHLEQIDWV